MTPFLPFTAPLKRSSGNGDFSDDGRGKWITSNMECYMWISVSSSPWQSSDQLQKATFNVGGGGGGAGGNGLVYSGVRYRVEHTTKVPPLGTKVKHRKQAKKVSLPEVRENLRTRWGLNSPWYHKKHGSPWHHPTNGALLENKSLWENDWFRL